MKRFLLVLTITLALLGQASCSPPAQTPAPTGTSSPVVAENTSAPTATVMPTATIVPTPKLPVAPGTAMPSAAQILSAENIDGITELARWGNGRIFDATYSPDGKLIAVATPLGITIDDAATLTEKVSFETDSAVSSVAFSPDGASVVVGLRDNSVSTWSISDARLLKTYEGEKKQLTGKNAPKEQVSAVAFSIDGSMIAAGSDEGIVNIWKASDGSLIRTLKSHTVGVTRLFFSPDGQELYSASYDGTVRLTQISDGKLVRAFGGHFIADAALSKDGNTLATYDEGLYGAQGYVYLWDVASGKKLQTIKAGNYYVYVTSLDFSPDGQLLATGWRDYTVKIWSVSNGSLQTTLEDLQPKTPDYLYTDSRVSFSPDGTNLLFAGNNVMATWNTADGTLLQNQKLFTEPIYSVTLSPDGKTVATGEGLDVHLRNFVDGSSFPGQAEMATYGNVAFSPDGNSIAVGLWDTTARIWPVTTQGLRKSFDTEPDKGWVTRVAFAPDGKTLALGVSPTIELRTISNGALDKKIYTGIGSDLSDLKYSPDGSILAFAGSSQTKWIRVEDGKTLKTSPGGSCLAFSPDGTLLATADYNDAVRIWNVSKGELVLTLPDNTATIWSLRFSNDGSLLIGGLGDGSMVVWSMPDGKVLKTWQAHASGVTEIQVSPDGKLLISSSVDGTIRVWGLKP